MGCFCVVLAGSSLMGEDYGGQWDSGFKLMGGHLKITSNCF